MASFFNPGSPRFRRGTIILSTAMMSFAGAHVIMGDFGSQKHVFTELQNWIIPQVDEAFGVSKMDILSYVEPVEEKTEQWLRLSKPGGGAVAGGSVGAGPLGGLGGSSGSGGGNSGTK